MWAFCQVCFCCPSFQHTGLLVTSITLGFFVLSFQSVRFAELGFCCAWSPPRGCQAKVVSTRLNLRNGMRYVRGMCNILSSVPLQQKSEMAEQCWSLVTAQFYLASKGKCILKAWGRTYPKEARGSILAPFFILSFFSFLPLSLPCVNCASQEGCLFHLKFSLWSLDLPLFYFCGLFSFLCLLAITTLDSFFLF